jgi:hypothetical protein
MVDPALKALIVKSLGGASDSFTVRDLALVAAGVDPLCAVQSFGNRQIAVIVDELQKRGFTAERITQTWGNQFVVGVNPAQVAELAAIYRGPDNPPPSVRKRIFELLGYAPLSLEAYLGGAFSPCDQGWSADERRFLGSNVGASVQAQAEALAWTRRRLGAFVKEYGRPAVAKISTVNFGS